MKANNILLGHNFKMLSKNYPVKLLELTEDQIKAYTIGSETVPDEVIVKLCEFYGIQEEHFKTLMLSEVLIKILSDRELSHEHTNEMLLEQLKHYSQKNAELQEGVLKLIEKVVTLKEENEKMKGFIEQVQGFAGPTEN